MKEEKQRLVIEGNAFYEIDLECIRIKENERKRKEEVWKRNAQKKEKAEE